MDVAGRFSQLSAVFDQVAFLSLVAMCVVIPVESLTPLLAGRTFAWVLGVIAASSYLLSCISMRQLPHVDWRLALAAAGWLAFGAGSMLWATDVGAAFSRVQTLAQAMAFFFLVPAVLSTYRRFTRLVVAYITSATVLSIVAVILAYVQDLKHAVLSEAQSPLHFGQALGVALVMIPFLTDCALSWKARLALFLCADVLSLAILLTGARGAWISLCCSMIGTIILTKGRGLNWRRVLVPVLAIGLQMFLIVHLGGLPSREWTTRRAVTVLNPVSVEGSSGRLEIWCVGWKMALANPVVGVGLQNFPARFEDYIEEAGFNQGYYLYPGRDAHSIYLSVFAELGIVGLAIVGLFMLLVLRRALAVWRHQGCSAGLLLTLLPLAYGAASTITYRKYFWFALALAATLTLCNGSQTENSRYLP